MVTGPLRGLLLGLSTDLGTASLRIFEEFRQCRSEPVVGHDDCAFIAVLGTTVWLPSRAWSSSLRSSKLQLNALYLRAVFVNYRVAERLRMLESAVSAVSSAVGRVWR